MKGITYLVDTKGKRKQVLIDLDLYGKQVHSLLEDIIDYNKAIEVSKTEKFVSWEKAKKRLLKK